MARSATDFGEHNTQRAVEATNYGRDLDARDRRTKSQPEQGCRRLMAHRDAQEQEALKARDQICAEVSGEQRWPQRW